MGVKFPLSPEEQSLSESTLILGAQDGLFGGIKSIHLESNSVIL